MNRHLLDHRDPADTLFGTAPADLIEPFEGAPSTLDEARRRAERIRAGLVSYVETRAAIAEAWARRDWRTLGYDSWEAYLGGEFGEELRRLAGPERPALVGDLREQGMSTRAIGRVLGVHKDTVRNDLSQVASDSPPGRITGADGKSYPAARPPSTKDTTDSPAGPATPPTQDKVADGDSLPPDRPGPNTAPTPGAAAASPPAATPAAEATEPLPASAAGDSSAVDKAMGRHLPPDPDEPHRGWRRGFLADVHAAYRPISRSSAEEVAERADEECFAELVRVSDELARFVAEVRRLRAASLPDNVIPLRGE